MCIGSGGGLTAFPAASDTSSETPRFSNVGSSVDRCEEVVCVGVAAALDDEVGVAAELAADVLLAC